MTAVEIVEVGPRDGLQNEATTLDVDTRVELITRLVDDGIRRMEAVSFVRPDMVPQMAGAEEIMAQLPQRDDVSYVGLVLNRRGAERAAQTACTEINIVVPVTDAFSTRNQNVTVQQMIAHAAGAVDVVRESTLRVSVTLAVAFGCPFHGAVSIEEVDDVYRRVCDLGIDEIAFADTIGVGVPDQVIAMGDLVRRADSRPGLRFHFHNTRNTGYANAAFASRLDGFDRVALDSSVGGFGGCPFAPEATGNIATEDLSYLLGADAIDRFPRGRVSETASWLSTKLRNPVQSLLPRAGDFPSVDRDGQA